MAELPFNPAELDEKDKAIFDAMVAKRKKYGASFGGPYMALMNHPELCQKIESLGGYLKFQGHLERNIYQFVVLAVAQSTKSAFEWGDHVNHAKASGVPEEVIHTLQKQGIAATYPHPYQLAADMLHYTLTWQNIPETLQGKAIAQWGKLGLIELVVLSGFYQLFSAINQGFNIPLDPGAQSPW